MSANPLPGEEDYKRYFTLSPQGRNRPANQNGYFLWEVTLQQQLLCFCHASQGHSVTTVSLNAVHTTGGTSKCSWSSKKIVIISGTQVQEFGPREWSLMSGCGLDAVCECHIWYPLTPCFSKTAYMLGLLSILYLFLSLSLSWSWQWVSWAREFSAYIIHNIVYIHNHGELKPVCINPFFMELCLSLSLYSSSWYDRRHRNISYEGSGLILGWFLRLQM